MEQFNKPDTSSLFIKLLRLRSLLQFLTMGIFVGFDLHTQVEKEAFGWGLTHRFTQRSAAKYVAMGVLLTGLVISMGSRDKKTLQRLSEW